MNAILFWTWELTFSKEYLTISPPPGQCLREHSNAQLIMAVLDLNHQRLNLSKRTCEDIPISIKVPMATQSLTKVVTLNL
jgi:hypothetical protein